MGLLGKAMSLGGTSLDILSNARPLFDSIKSVKLRKNPPSIPLFNSIKVPMVGADALTARSIQKISSSKETPMNLRDKLIKYAHEHKQPTMSVKDMLVKAIRTKIASKQPKPLTPFANIKLAGALGDALESALEKAPNIAALTALGGAAAGSVYELGSLANAKYKQYKAYHQMFEEFPEFKDMKREQVDKYWQVLKDYAPSFTENPLVAGQFISNMMQYNMRGVDHAVAGSLAKSQSDVMKGRATSMTPITSNTLKIMGQAALGQQPPAMWADPRVQNIRNDIINHNETVAAHNLTQPAQNQAPLDNMPKM